MTDNLGVIRQVCDQLQEAGDIRDYRITATSDGGSVVEMLPTPDRYPQVQVKLWGSLTFSGVLKRIKSVLIYFNSLNRRQEDEHE